MLEHTALKGRDMLCRARQIAVISPKASARMCLGSRGAAHGKQHFRTNTKAVTPLAKGERPQTPIQEAQPRRKQCRNREYRVMRR